MGRYLIFDRFYTYFKSVSRTRKKNAHSYLFVWVLVAWSLRGFYIALKWEAKKEMISQSDGGVKHAHIPCKDAPVIILSIILRLIPVQRVKLLKFWAIRWLKDLIVSILFKSLFITPIYLLWISWIKFK